MISIKGKGEDYQIRYNGTFGEVTTELVALMGAYYQMLIEAQEKEKNPEIKAKKAFNEMVKLSFKAKENIEIDKEELEFLYENG